MFSGGGITQAGYCSSSSLTRFLGANGLTCAAPGFEGELSMTMRTLSLGLALGGLVLAGGCKHSTSYRQTTTQPAIVQSSPVAIPAAAPCPPAVIVPAPACTTPGVPPPVPPPFGR